MLREIGSFDAGRAVLEDYLDGSLYPPRLDVKDSEPLREALAAGKITPETHLLAFEQDGRLYACPMSVVLCYNVIQGSSNNQQWMMTFCNACNTGMVFDPLMDGQTLHFCRRGSYNGLLLIWDEETASYWQHITGECLHGRSQGKHLRLITMTRHITVADALGHSPETVLLTQPLTPEQQMLSGMMEKMRSNPARLEAEIVATIEAEDTRRPRFELGLGVWTAATSTFFPLVMLHTHNNIVFTEFNGRSLLIYQTPEAIAPVAAYLPKQHVFWEGETLRLEHGASIQNDLYVTPDGRWEPLDSPMQLLMRWYGFALTFPGCALPEM